MRISLIIHYPREPQSENGHCNDLFIKPRYLIPFTLSCQIRLSRCFLISI
jgi:hypothetical protein